MDEAPRKDALGKSIAEASTSERAWGIKAALAGKKVRDWYRELEAWPWPTTSGDNFNGFESPDEAQRARKFNAKDEPKDATYSFSERSDRDEDLYWGSLTAHKVQEYEERIEEIRDDMETLEFEELKEHVRATHVPSHARRSTYGQMDTNHTNGHVHLDDFTAVITATIMQMLPHISRLNALLGIWSVRLLVLRQVPGFLQCMQKTHAAMDSAWKTVEQPPFKGSLGGPIFTRADLVTMQAVLENRIDELGRRLDSMLDALEGREDTVPDRWIEEMDFIESDFGNWVVKAENLVLRNEMRTAKAGAEFPSNAPSIRGSNDDSAPIHAVSSSAKETSARSNDKVLLHSNPEIRDVRQMEESQRQIKDSVGPDGGHKTEPEAICSIVNPQTPSQKGTNETGNISSHLRKLLASREASVERTSSPFAFSSATSPSPKAHVDLPGSASFEPLISQGEKSALSADREVVRSRNNSKPPPLTLYKPQPTLEGHSNLDFSLEASYPSSTTSDYFSNMSSPEIQHASRAEYVGAPVEVISPSLTQKDQLSPFEVISRPSSQRTERGRPMSEDISIRSFTTPVGMRSRASSFIPETAVLEDTPLAESQHADRKGVKSHWRTRSACMQSFEVVPPNEVSSSSIHTADEAHISVTRSAV